MWKWISDRVRSFGFAGAGLKELFRSQGNAQVHLAAAVLVVAASWYCAISRVEWCLVAGAIAAVFAAEAMNTAVEKVVDLVSPQHHPVAGQAKDLAAAAVLLTALGAAAIGILIFGPRLLQWLAG